MRNLTLCVLAAAMAATGTTSATTRFDASGVRDEERYAGVIVRYVDAQPRDARSGLLRSQAVVADAVSRATLAGVRLDATRPGAAGEVLRFAQPLAGDEMRRLLRAFADDPRVAFVEADVRMQHTGFAKTSTPDDPRFTDAQWHFHDAVAGIDAPRAWPATTGSGIVVAVVDTGIVAHADMDANVLPNGYDFIFDGWTNGRGANGRVPGGHDLGDWSGAGECTTKDRDSSWHGTHVAGTIAQVTHNGLMGAGVAHGAKILPVRVLGRCGGTLSDVVDGIVWAAGGDVPGVPANTTPADVINVSLGGGGICTPGSAMHSAIGLAISRGATVVVAAGNAAMDAAYVSPASCTQAITVGATDVHGARAFYSNFGGVLDIAAPGGGMDPADGDRGWIWQAVNAGKRGPEGDTFKGMVGTSMAAPHVAGIAALMQSVAPQRLASGSVEYLLQSTARAFPEAPDAATPIGLGIANAGGAVDAAATMDPCWLPAGCVPKQSTVVANRIVAAVEDGAGSSSAGPIYRFEVPAGKTLVSVRTFGGTGDATLLLRNGAEPMSHAYEQRSARPGNTETVSVRAPRAGTWYAKVAGTHAGVSLHVRID